LERKLHSAISMKLDILCIDNEVESIAAEIMAYLNERPMASDSLDGIAHWWLVQQAIAKNLTKVELALEKLASEGKISKTMNSSKTAIYSLNAVGADKPT
jgi:hypothetical protein